MLYKSGFQFSLYYYEKELMPGTLKDCYKIRDIVPKAAGTL